MSNVGISRLAARREPTVHANPDLHLHSVTPRDHSGHRTTGSILVRLNVKRYKFGITACRARSDALPLSVPPRCSLVTGLGRAALDGTDRVRYSPRTQAPRRAQAPHRAVRHRRAPGALHRGLHDARRSTLGRTHASTAAAACRGTDATASAACSPPAIFLPDSLALPCAQRA